MRMLLAMSVLAAACGSEPLDPRAPDAGDPHSPPDAGAALDASADAGQASLCPDGVVAGSVMIERAAELTRLEGCREIEGALFLYAADLTTLAPLHALERIGDDLGITVGEGAGEPGADHLASLAGLESLREIGAKLMIERNPNLADLRALANLTRVGSIFIRENGKLGSLEGLHNVSRTGSFICEYNALADLDGARGLRSVRDNLYINHEPLSTLRGLSGLESAGQVSLEALPIVEIGLTKLRSVASFLEIMQNPELTEVASLESLEHVMRNLVIVRNPALDDAAARAWAEGVVVDGFVKIAGNAEWQPPSGPCPFTGDDYCDESSMLCGPGTDSLDCMNGG
jgi:hypothetical protein